MQKRVSRELSRTFPDLVEKYNTDYCVAINDYETNLLNHDYSTYNSNNINISSLSLSSIKYDCYAIIKLRSQYPFKPPEIYLCNNYNNNYNNIQSMESYQYWCSRILNKKDNYSIFISYVFTCFAMPTLLGINKMVPDNSMCLCCESLTCSNRWSPIVNIFTVLNECVFRKNIHHYLHSKYSKYFDEIFKNERWCLPDDAILAIIEFL